MLDGSIDFNCQIEIVDMDQKVQLLTAADSRRAVHLRESDAMRVPSNFLVAG